MAEDTKQPSARTERWTRILSRARWISIVLCVAILTYRYFDLTSRNADNFIDVTGDMDGVSAQMVSSFPLTSFTDPTAQHLGEVARQLVDSPRERRQAARQLHAITSRPVELLGDDFSLYLTLRTAYWQLRRDPNIAGSYEAALAIWQAAEQIEAYRQFASASAEAPVGGPPE